MDLFERPPCTNLKTKYKRNVNSSRSLGSFVVVCDDMRDEKPWAYCGVIWETEMRNDCKLYGLGGTNNVCRGLEAFKSIFKRYLWKCFQLLFGKSFHTSTLLLKRKCFASLETITCQLIAITSPFSQHQELYLKENPFNPTPLPYVRKKKKSSDL